MSNMLGFEEACCLTHDNKLNSGKIGVHLVLTEGKPITNEIRKCNKFCDKNGEFLSEIIRNCGKLNTNYQLLKTVYKYFMNKKLRNLGYARTNYFGSVDDYIYSKEILKTEENTSIEIMIHSRHKENKLVDSDGKLLESKFFQAGLITTNAHK